ncbi:MAG TPA: four-helix bundle copper-binding protein [Solirubrobacteraceae bacterium]|nr:four-helix bundle copper-binding protein [Solirubrobacteraceae bacterium]
MDTREMLASFRIPIPLGIDEVATVIDACLNCAQSCTSCADADLLEDDVDEMRRCAALDASCADLCETTARILSRPGQWDEFVVHRLLQACARVCDACAEECARHAAHHRHCAICEKACRACERACNELLEGEAFTELQKLAGG